MQRAPSEVVMESSPPGPVGGDGRKMPSPASAEELASISAAHARQHRAPKVLGLDADANCPLLVRWQNPEGGSSGIAKRMDHPAVHIAYPDAEAYCQWLGKRLPTEAEYEFAARGGLHGKKYAWGDEVKPKGKWRANIWQGKFPTKNTAGDGFVGTSPVRAFPPNGFGLYDMGGNVWQWTATWYRADTYTKEAKVALTRDPKGPDSSLDPRDPGIAKRVQRGGSFLCSDTYCTRYLVGSRGKGAVDSAGSNVGFRCVKNL